MDASYDVQDNEARMVIGQAAHAAQEFNEHKEVLARELAGAATQSGSELVASALDGLATNQADQLERIYSRVNAAVSGGSQAINAYVRGDEEMLHNAQRQAAAAPDPRSMPGGGPR